MARACKLTCACQFAPAALESSIRAESREKRGDGNRSTVISIVQVLRRRRVVVVVAFEGGRGQQQQQQHRRRPGAGGSAEICALAGSGPFHQLKASTALRTHQALPPGH